MIETERRRRSGFSADRSGQSAPVAVALLLGITLLGTGVVFALGSGAFADAQASAARERVEQAMTALDARAADVALGDATSQRLALGPSGGGAYAVDEDAGRIEVIHRNATGDGADETLYEGTLGAVTYRDGDATVAYQGGGVWRRQGGGTVMVSPPEFHYRGDTLTLPVVSVAGSGGVAGDATATVASAGTERAYPNRTRSYDGTDRPYVNPLRNGTVAVTVRSDYYQGWAEYFRARTAGDVTVDREERTATVELTTPSDVGRFERLEVRGMPDEHAVQTFEATIAQGNNLNNLYFSYHATTATQEFEMVLHVPSGSKPCRKGGGTLQMDVYYDDRSTEGHHVWTNDSIPAGEGPIRVQCSADGAEIVADFTGDTPLTYGSASTDGGNSKWYHDREGEVAATATFDHEGDDGASYSAGQSLPLSRLAPHYLAELGPDFVLLANYGPGNSPRVDPGASSADLDYTRTPGRYVTYLHVTENDLRVELD